MKFHLVDRIESIEPGRRIVTTKALSLAEEYLADHFPAFPVLPGVLMVEAMVQAAAWLVRVEQNFTKSLIVLGAARNVKYAHFVQPGRVLRCEVQALSIEPDGAKVKATGTVGQTLAVSGRLELRSFNLADRRPGMASTDKAVLGQVRRSWSLVGGPAALGASAAS